jgi:hypothetical protein
VKKVVPLLALVVALIISAPLAIALVVVGILAPAAVSVIDCGAHLPGAATGDWRPPFQQRYVLTSAFGRRFHPIYKEWRLHTGQDLSSLPNAGPVIAAAAGTVISTHREPVYGKIVSLRHGNGVVTRYGHLASINPKIIPGARVGIGQRIGIEGSTGTSTGLHLHFQVEVNGTPVNPVRFMADRGAPLDGKAVAPFREAVSPTSLSLSGDALEGGVGFPIPHPGTRAERRCRTRRCPSRKRSKSSTWPPRPGTRFPGLCWPGSAWKKPGTGATTTPAPPAHRA